MRMFPGIDHPDGVKRLPGSFVEWSIQIDQIERQIEAEREAKRWAT